MNETNSIIAFVSLCIVSFLGYSIRQLITRLDVLWDAHNQKIDDSDRIKSLETKFDKHELLFTEFRSTIREQNAQIFAKLTVISKDNDHRNKETSKDLENIFNAIRKLDDK